MTTKGVLALALEALETIALAGMSGTGQESQEALTEWHARRAWEFIGIAARAITAIKQAQQAQEPRLMHDCFDLLDSFEYEDDEDSQSKAFFKAHINVDWFFHVKNSLERQLPPEAKK